MGISTLSGLNPKEMDKKLGLLSVEHSGSQHGVHDGLCLTLLIRLPWEDIPMEMDKSGFKISVITDPSLSRDLSFILDQEEYVTWKSQ